MKLSERFEGICSYFEQNMSSAASELVFASPYQLLVAVMLSAQCTDRRVNMTTPELFRKYPGVKELSEADYEELLDIIKCVIGFVLVKKGVWIQNIVETAKN